MENSENKTPAGANGEHSFSMNYAEKEVPVVVQKNNNSLQVHIDDKLYGDLHINDDGSVVQTSGDEIPQSAIDFIKKHVLGHDK